MGSVCLLFVRYLGFFCLVGWLGFFCMVLVWTSLSEMKMCENFPAKTISISLDVVIFLFLQYLAVQQDSDVTYK